MRDRATTLLDVLGLLLVAFGLGAAAYPFVGLASALISGGTVLGGSHFASRGTGGKAQ